MVEVWAMNPTPNSMYMAHQYRLLDCKRGFSANKSRKMGIQMFTISVVFFIFCCKFYTFFMFVCWCIVVRSANDAACFAAFWQTVSNVWQFVRSVIGIPSAAVGVRFIVPAYTYSPRIRNPFRIHSRNVCNVFVFCMLHIRITKVWFLSCKKGVFELQKYGFCFLNVALLQSVCHAFAICKQRIRIRPPRCCNPFATFSHPISSVVAICLQAKSLNLLCV